jgi:hypothetical protein
MHQARKLRLLDSQTAARFARGLCMPLDVMTSKVVLVNELSMHGELVAICRAIAARNLSDTAWAQIESGDEFQSPSVCGGYEATERAFSFSLYFPNKDEQWVTVTLQQALAIATEAPVHLELRRPS